MASAPLSKNSLRWIRHPARSSCSVEEDETGSKPCSMNRMALSWSINGCLSGEDINGQGSSQRFGISPGESLAGWCQEFVSTSPKRSKQNKTSLDLVKNPAQKKRRTSFCHDKALQEQADYLTKKLFGFSSERRRPPGTGTVFHVAVPQWWRWSSNHYPVWLFTYQKRQACKGSIPWLR